MDQRESLQLPFALVGQTFGSNGKTTFALLLGKYFIDEKITDLPLIFLDRKGIESAIQRAMGYAQKLDAVKNGTAMDIPLQLSIHDTLYPLEAPDSSNLSDLMANYTIASMDKVVLCVLQFEETGNSVSIVGGASSGNYYIIDVTNRIFCVTTCPEYDIPDYGERFGGSGGFKATFWVDKTSTIPPKEKEEETAPEKPKKKAKKETEVEVVEQEKTPPLPHSIPVEDEVVEKPTVVKIPTIKRRKTTKKTQETPSQTVQ